MTSHQARRAKAGAMTGHEARPAKAGAMTGHEAPRANGARRGAAALVATLGLAGSAAGTALAQPSAPTAITCEEKLPAGATRPSFTETMAGEAGAGEAVRLELEVSHGRGETVLPGGFRIHPGTELSRAVGKAGFALADPEGTTQVTVDVAADGLAKKTKVSIPFVVLPVQSGDRSLVLPSLPFTVARASGETMTLCTALHLVAVRDPTTGATDPAVRPNPPARPQREEWTLLKWIVLGVGSALVLGTIVGLGLRRALRKPVVDFVPPPEVPWVRARRELDALRRGPLLGEGRTEELFDQVSDVMRRYLGDRYGFEGLGVGGLDRTTDEMMTLLQKVSPPVRGLETIRALLEEADLVKFARVRADEAACLAALARADEILDATRPRAGETGGPEAPAQAAEAPAGRPAPAEASADPYASYAPPPPAPPEAAAPAPPPRADAAPEALPPAAPARDEEPPS